MRPSLFFDILDYVLILNDYLLYKKQIIIDTCKIMFLVKSIPILNILFLVFIIINTKNNKEKMHSHS